MGVCVDIVKGNEKKKIQHNEMKLKQIAMNWNG